MATITTINATDLLSASRAVINTNFSNLNSAKVDGATALTTAGRLVEVASSGVATQTSFASSVVVLTNGSYADPAWVTSLATTKLTGTLQAAQFPALTGDVTTNAGAVATTLANTAVTPASYGSATQVATFTVDSKGRLTAAASTSIAIAASQVTSGTLDNARTTAASTNTVSAIVARDASGNFAAGTITATFSGNLTGNVTGNASGTAATITGALALANTPLTTRGDLLVATTATPILGRLAKGTQYQVLLGGATDPTWGAVDLAQASAITGILPVGNGGTGATTLSGAGIVAGAASITTANALLIGASAGVLGQSDATFVSGVLTRAGTLGLSATGANVVTFSTNGVERGRFDASGAFSSLVSVFGTLAALDAAVTGIAGTPTQASVTNNNTNTDVVRIANGNNTIGATTQAFKTRAASGSAATTIVQSGDTIGQFDFLGADGAAYRTAARFRVVVDGTPGLSDMPGRFSFFTTPDGSAAPEERLTIKSNGAVLIGTTTDDGSGSKVQVAGVILANGASAGLRLNTRDTGSDWLLYSSSVGFSFYSTTANAGLFSIASSGTATVYNPVAVTGVTSLVVRAGAGQSTTALQTWQNNAGTAVLSVDPTGTLIMPTNSTNYAVLQAMSGGADNGNYGLYFNHTDQSVIMYAGTTNVLEARKSKVGFFGVAPVARQTATADAASILALLQAYGLSN